MSNKNSSQKQKKKLQKRLSKNHELRKQKPDPNIMEFEHFSATVEPLNDPLIEALPEKAQEEIAFTFYHMRQNPRAILPRIRKMIEYFPEVPRLYSQLFSCYMLLEETENADKVTQEIYRKFPDFIFAKIFFAEYCFGNDNLEQIPEIFEEKFELQLLYPERELYHMSEVMSFAYTVGKYQCFILDVEKAQNNLDMLLRIDANDERTKQLQGLLEQATTFRNAQQEFVRSAAERYEASKTEEDGLPVFDFLTEYDPQNVGDAIQLGQEFTTCLEEGYFLEWEAIVAEEQGQELSEAQQKALKEVAQEDRIVERDDNDRILLIDGLPRPKQPWHTAIARISESMILHPFETKHDYPDFFTTGWTELFEMIDIYGKDLSCPEDIENPLDLIRVDVMHRLWIQVAFDVLSGLGQEDFLPLGEDPNAELRVNDFIEELKEEVDSVKHFNPTLEQLLSWVRMPKSDEKVLVQMMLKELNMESPQVPLISVL